MSVRAKILSVLQRTEDLVLATQTGEYSDTPEHIIHNGRKQIVQVLDGFCSELKGKAEYYCAQCCQHFRTQKQMEVHKHPTKIVGELCLADVLALIGKSEGSK